MRQGLYRQTFTKQHICQAMMRIGVVRIDGHGTTIKFDRLIDFCCGFERFA